MTLKLSGHTSYWVLALSVLTVAASGKAVAAEPRGTHANVMIELPFTAADTYKDPFNEVTLDVIFTDPNGKEFRVPAFWAGATQWKVRYASPVPGTHGFRSESSTAQDKGLHGVTGHVDVEPYTGKNPLYVHGPLRVAANKRHLERGDGTPFFWLGDTWWMGLSKRLAWPEDVKTLAQDRKRKGFNVIQIVVGPPPDSHPFDPRSVNEAGFPWEEGYTAIRPAYYDAADERIMYLVDEGFTPCLFGMWGYHMRFMGVERAKQHWRYLIARYGALPVVWCAAGEANLSWYLAPGFPYHDKEQVANWTRVTRYLRETDPFDRLVTVHPTGFGWTARDAIDDAALLDFDMLQTPHGQRDAVPVTLEVVRRSYAGKPVMPTINGEAAYEMLSDTLPTAWTRRMFWLCMTNGAAGHTYGANGIWQVNRRGDPHGPSPHMQPGVGYGAIPWDEAMNLAGSTQVAHGKKFFEQFEWHKFTPHPEWAESARKATLSFDGAQWIWFAEGNPAANAPAEKRCFRRQFELPQGKKITDAQLRISADDRFSVNLNGEAVGASGKGQETWRTGRQFDDLAKLLKPGANVLAIEAENLPAPGANPAGLIAHLEIRFADGEPLSIKSDETWLGANAAPAGWDQPGFDDAAWSNAMSLGQHGASPWGAIDGLSNDDILRPHSTGIPGVVRLTYVPEPEVVVRLRNLGRNAAYSAEWFDPVSGEQKPLPPIQADEKGTATRPPPDGHDHDWVLILKPQAAAAPATSNHATLSDDYIVWHFD